MLCRSANARDEFSKGVDADGIRSRSAQMRIGLGERKPPSLAGKVCADRLGRKLKLAQSRACGQFDRASLVAVRIGVGVVIGPAAVVPTAIAIAEAPREAPVTVAKTCDMVASATQVRDADRMSDVAARDSVGAANSTTNAASAATDMSTANMGDTNVTTTNMAAAHSAANMATTEMAATHSAAKVTTPATAAVAASAATTSEGFGLYRAHSQSGNRKDDSNLAQHPILHLGRSRALISGYCRHSAPSSTLWPDHEFT